MNAFEESSNVRNDSYSKYHLVIASSICIFLKTFFFSGDEKKRMKFLLLILIVTTTANLLRVDEYNGPSCQGAPLREYTMDATGTCASVFYDGIIVYFKGTCTSTSNIAQAWQMWDGRECVGAPFRVVDLILQQCLDTQNGKSIFQICVVDTSLPQVDVTNPVIIIAIVGGIIACLFVICIAYRCWCRRISSSPQSVALSYNLLPEEAILIN